MYKFNFYHSRPENFFRNTDPKKTEGLIGYLRGDLGRSGNEFHHTWFNEKENLCTPTFKEEFDSVVEALKRNLFPDRAYMKSIVYGNPQTKLPLESTDSNGMFVDTQRYEYDIRIINDPGNYDFYIYCYDKNVQEPQYLNAKRFRDENGKLTERVEDIAEKTLAEARNYYTARDRYEYQNKIYTLVKNEDGMTFVGKDGEKIFVAPDKAGLFLPDVASEGMSFAKVTLEQSLSRLTVGDLLQGTKMEDVHLTHKDEEIDLATIAELDSKTLTDEGKARWANVLNARVENIYEGSYGVQIECSGVEAQELADFSQMLAGNCSAEEYDKWVQQDEPEGPTMNM